MAPKNVLFPCERLLIMSTIISPGLTDEAFDSTRSRISVVGGYRCTGRGKVEGRNQKAAEQILSPTSDTTHYKQFRLNYLPNWQNVQCPDYCSRKHWLHTVKQQWQKNKQTTKNNSKKLGILTLYWLTQNTNCIKEMSALFTVSDTRHYERFLPNFQPNCKMSCVSVHCSDKHWKLKTNNKTSNNNQTNKTKTTQNSRFILFNTKY